MSDSFFNKIRLRDIINGLSQGYTIEDKTEFLRKYDNGNSIWEANEITEIKQDYREGKLDSLFEAYRNEHPANMDNSSYIEDYRLKRNLNSLSEEENQRLTYLLDTFGSRCDVKSDYLIKLAKFPAETYNKVLAYLETQDIENEGRVIINILSSFVPENFDKIFKYTNIRDRGEEQLNILSLKELSNLDDNELSKIEKYMYIKEREGFQFKGADLVALAKLSPEKLAFAEKYMFIEGRGKNQLSGEDIVKLCNMDEATLKKAEKYLYIEDRENDQLDVIDIMNLIEMDEGSLAIIEKYIGVKGRGEHQFPTGDLIFMSKLTPEKLAILDEFAYIEALGDEQLTFMDISNFIGMDEDELSIVREYMYKDRGGKHFTGRDLAALSYLNKDELQIIEPYIYLENRKDNQFTGQTLRELARLDEDTRNKIMKYSFIEELGDNQLSGGMLLDLVDLSEDEIDELIPFFRANDVLTLAMAMGIKDTLGDNIELMNRFIDEHPNLDVMNFGNIYSLNPEMAMQFYNEHNINITKVTANSIIAVDGKNSYEFNVINRQLIETHYMYNNGAKSIRSQTITTFGENNNPIKTRTITPGGVGGVSNISETENGVTTPVQFSSVDPNNGGITISKNYTSPLGTKTEMYLEKNPDGLMILNYKITKPREFKLLGEKTLLDRSMTFQQVSDNEFITSVNNRTYKLTADENKITVIDMKTKKTKEIVIDDILLNNAKDIIPQIIMHIPANILFSMNSDRLRIKYNPDVLNNAACGPEVDGDIASNKTLFELLDMADGTNPQFSIIEMGDQLYTDDLTEGLLSVFLHEYGHFLDFDLENTQGTVSSSFGIISNNEDVEKAFAKESAKFKKRASLTEQEASKYITENLQEMVAEVCMLMNGIPSELSAVRSAILQEYFPETIAIIARLLDERIKALYEAELQNYKDAQ